MSTSWVLRTAARSTRATQTATAFPPITAYGTAAASRAAVARNRRSRTSCTAPTRRSRTTSAVGVCIPNMVASPAQAPNPNPLMTSTQLHAASTDYFRGLQDRICAGLEAADGTGKFREDSWDRADGGGGRSRVLVEGGVFEKAGVNFSEVFGKMSPEFAKQIPGEGNAFTATGVSLVLHLRNPLVPTVHANFRYLTKGDRSLFGGGADSTPYYPVLGDVAPFHTTWTAGCEKRAPLVDYASMKKDCDDYFFLAHRQEARGVGGIFIDYKSGDMDRWFAFVRDAGDTFLPSYVPIVARRKDTPYGDRER